MWGMHVCKPVADLPSSSRAQRGAEGGGGGNAVGMRWASGGKTVSSLAPCEMERGEVCGRHVPRSKLRSIGSPVHDWTGGRSLLGTLVLVINSAACFVHWTRCVGSQCVPQVGGWASMPAQPTTKTPELSTQVQVTWVASRSFCGGMIAPYGHFVLSVERLAACARLAASRAL